MFSLNTVHQSLAYADHLAADMANPIPEEEEPAPLPVRNNPAPLLVRNNYLFTLSPNDGCFTLCLKVCYNGFRLVLGGFCDTLHDLIQAVRLVAVAIFEFICCCDCLDEEDAHNYSYNPPPIPVLHNPLPPPLANSWSNPSPSALPKFDIPLTPNVLPGTNCIEAEPTPCPIAPLPNLSDLVLGQKSVADVLREIKQVVKNDQNQGIGGYGNYDPRLEGAQNLIRQHRDLLTQEHWIDLLQEIAPSERELISDQLSDGAFNNLLDGIPEVAQKRTLACLATYWVQLKKLDSVFVDLNHPFAEIFRSFDDFRGLGDPLSTQIEFQPEALMETFLQKEDAGTTFTTTSTQKEKVQEFLALQELSRFAPLLRAFANEKKNIRVQVPGYEEKGLEVNYLRDAVFKMARQITGFFFYHVSGPLTLKQTGSNRFDRFRCGELNADKVIRILDLAWNSYAQAKVNGDLKNFYEKLDTNGCFDWRSSSLWNYMQTFSSHPDFTFQPNQFKEKTMEFKVAELHRVFMNEQYAVYCERQEPKLKYEDFKQKIEYRDENAKNDPEVVRFFDQYATLSRFEAWIQQKEFQEVLLMEFSSFLHWSGRTVSGLMNDMAIDFLV